MSTPTKGLQHIYDEARCEGIGLAVVQELKRASRLHRPMASPHEAYAILQEEAEEFWDEIRTCKHWRTDAEARDRMRKEATQIAAMAMRFILDICKT